MLLDLSNMIKTTNLSSCDVLRAGVLCYVKGRVTSGSDAWCYVTQWRVDLSRVMDHRRLRGCVKYD